MKVLITIFLLSSLLTDIPAQTISFITACEASEFCTDENNCGPVDILLNAEATSTCPSDGLSISYTIDLDDDGTIDESGSGNQITGTYPLGIHRAVFTAVDNCAGEELCEIVFNVKDCTAPIAQTYNGLAAEQDSTGLTIAASDFNFGSSDNCGIASFLMVSPSMGPGQLEPPLDAAPSWFFDCEMTGVQTLDFWVSDEAGNWSYTSTYVIAQDNVEPFCDGPNFIELCLSAFTECGEPILNVNYSLGAPGIPDIPIYDFDSCDTLPSYPGSLIVSAYKDINHNNGVTTLDIIGIYKHILDIEFLDSPYKIIAADVNRDGSVSTFDLIQIRRIILGIDTVFSNNTSWRFIDSVYVFPNPDNPFEAPLPEICTINGPGSFWKTFIGVKIGDVNKTASPIDSLLDGAAEDRTVFNLDLIDQRFEVGEEVVLDFYSKDIKDHLGFQFELDFDADFLKFERFQKGDLKHMSESNLGLQNVAQGKILTSWINTDFDQIENNETAMFSFHFTAVQSGTLRDFISLTNSKLNSEAYTFEENIAKLNIQFSEAIPQSDFTVTTTPNPFQKETTIEFDLPEADQVSLKILDVKGRLIKTTQGDFEKGKNRIKLEEENFPTNGIYFFQLETSRESKTGKMLKI